MLGRRVYPPAPTKEDPHPLPDDCQKGDYWYQEDMGCWMCFPPFNNDHGGLVLGNLSKHQVIENEDKTITVSPSILVWNGPQADALTWHGYLERGIWREV